MHGLGIYNPRLPEKRLCAILYIKAEPIKNINYDELTSTKKQNYKIT